MSLLLNLNIFHTHLVLVFFVNFRHVVAGWALYFFQTKGDPEAWPGLMQTFKLKNFAAITKNF